MKNPQTAATPFEIFAFACSQGWLVVLETSSGPHQGRALPARRSHGGTNSPPYRIRQDGKTLEFRFEDVTAVAIA